MVLACFIGSICRNEIFQQQAFTRESSTGRPAESDFITFETTHCRGRYSSSVTDNSDVDATLLGNQ